MLNKDLKRYYSFFKKKSKNIKLNYYVYLRLLICPFDKIYLSTLRLKNINKVLDIGGGYGIFVDYLKFKNKNLIIEASEFNKNRVKIGKEVIDKTIVFSQKDASKEKFENYDLITMIDLLHHISYEKQEEIFKNISKTNSYILIKDIEKDYFDPRYYWNLIHDKLMTKGDKLYFRSDKSFTNIFKKNKFKVLYKKRIFTLAPYPHIIYIIKK